MSVVLEERAADNREFVGCGVSESVCAPIIKRAVKVPRVLNSSAVLVFPQWLGHVVHLLLITTQRRTVRRWGLITLSLCPRPPRHYTDRPIAVLKVLLVDPVSRLRLIDRDRRSGLQGLG